MSESDRIYAESRPFVVDFTFDRAVAEVFPDMIRRSVPGYETVISTLGVLAQSHFRPATRVYDLGCSLGAATLSVHRCLGDADAHYVLVDNASAMLERCRGHLDRLMPGASVEYREADIRAVRVENASVVILNFTIQFVPPDDRQALLENIHAGLVPGGCLILSEKVLGEDPGEDRCFSDLHLRFKAANGYSDLEISQKRSALERVLRPDSLAQHQERLSRAGFASIRPWFRCLNFVSLLAVK